MFTVSYDPLLLLVVIAGDSLLNWFQAFLFRTKNDGTCRMKHIESPSCIFTRQRRTPAFRFVFFMVRNVFVIDALTV